MMTMTRLERRLLAFVILFYMTSVEAKVNHNSHNSNRDYGWPTKSLLLSSWMLNSRMTLQSSSTSLQPSSQSTSIPTVVSGYGSRRSKLAGTVRATTVTTTTTVRTNDNNNNSGGDDDTASTVQREVVSQTVVQAKRTDFPLYIQPLPSPQSSSSTSSTSSGTSTALHVYSAVQNVTVVLTATAVNDHTLASVGHGGGGGGDDLRKQWLQPLPPPQLRATTLVWPTKRGESTDNRPLFNLSQDWIPVEGLYGVYNLPSGLVCVWIAQSEPVYTAVHHDNAWWQIRKVTELHLTRVVAAERPEQDSAAAPATATPVVPSSPKGTRPITTTTTRAQRHHEHRQLALFRQALKEHEWYYSVSSIIPDMTRNLQTCILATSTTIKTAVREGEVDNPLAATTAAGPVNSDQHSKMEGDPPVGLGDSPSRMNEGWENVVEDEHDNDDGAELSLPVQTAHKDRNNDGNESTRIRRWWEVATSNDEESHHYPQQRRPDSRFFWNEAVVQPLIQAVRQQQQQHNDTVRSGLEVLLEHVIPVTSAFCGVQTNLTARSDESNVAGADVAAQLRYDQVLISRRSRFRAGTRFTKRGADATGAVANYAETEQLLVVWQNNAAPRQMPTTSIGCRPELKALMSHVQTRGSIPLRWSSPTDIKTYRPRIRIGTDPLAHARAVQQHLIDQAARYIVLPPINTTTDTNQNSTTSTTNSHHPSLLLVNLVDKKSDQGRLGRALDAVLKAVLDVYSTQIDPLLPWLNASYIQHLWFDFHAQVKSGRWDKLVGLLDTVKPAIMGQGYFLAVPITVNNDTDVSFRVERIQTGVVRTNCMDCLDRTNVVQSLFGRYMLFQQLSDYKASRFPLPFKIAFRKAPMTLPWMDGEVAHRFLWADNADAISRLYAGTPALKGDFTRMGKRTKRGALDDGMNSLQRYYLNNFLDADRQEGIDLLTGYEPFSNIDELEFNDLEDETHSMSSSRRLGMSVQEAARRMLLGTLDDEHQINSGETDRDHVRIKVKRRKFLESHGTVGGFNKRRRQSLDLRWLPGDLQSQVRDRVSFCDDITDDDFPSREFLQSMDRRAASDMPWWVVADSSDSDHGATAAANAPVYEAEATAANNPGYLLGALVAGTSAPLTMAAVVMGLVAAFLPLSEQKGQKDEP